MREEPLCLLDIRGLVLRRFHASDKTWQDGFQEFLARDLGDVLELFPPRRIVACFDAGNEVRSEVFGDYKKARRDRASEQDPTEKEQIKRLLERVRTFLASIGVKTVSVPGGEADDLIALFCRQLSCPLTVWTVDADLLQLVRTSPRVIVRLGDRIFHDPEQLHNGVPLHLIRLHKSIVGDTSDGYSGVPGIGPAGWDKLVELVGLDGMAELEEIVQSGNQALLIEAVGACHDKVLGKLLYGWDRWKLSYSLASLHPDSCYSVRGDKIVSPKWDVRVPSAELASQVLFSAGATDLLPQYAKWFPTERLIDANNVGDLATLPTELYESPIVSWDFESYDTLKHAAFKKAAKSSDFVDVLSQSVTGLSVNYGSNLQKTFYLTVNHADSNNASKDWLRWVLSCLFALPRPTVVQNANFELTVSQTDLGIPEEALGQVYDTAIMSSYVDENLENRLKEMSKHWLGYTQQTYREVVGDRTMDQVPALEVMSYGCDDSLVSSHLFDLFKLIMELEGSWEFYRRYEVNHVKDAVGAFIDGCPIDLDLIQTFSDEEKTAIKSADAEIRKSLAERVNSRSQSVIADAARELLAMRWELSSLKHQRTDSPECQREYARLWQGAWEDCFYAPFEEEIQVPEFSLTPGKINQVVRALGFERPMFESTLSGNQISDWLEVFYDDVEPNSPESDSLNDLRRFVSCLTRLSQAATTLQKRASKGGLGSLTRDEVTELPEYASLSSLAAELLVKHGVGKKITRGDELNYGSNKQMQAFLYGKLGLPVRKHSKVLRGSTRDRHGLTGAPATGNAAAAAAIVYDTPEGDWRRPVLMGYRRIVAAQQNLSLFYGPYPLWVHPRDGNIHPQIKNCGTVTRRPSGTSPNILQVSKKEGAKVRKLYLPWSEEYIHVSIDFKQQEVVITACESGDKVMLEALKEGKDIHSVTATGFAHVLAERAGHSGQVMSYEQFIDFKSVDPVTHKKIRDAAKAVLFLVFYGGGAATLASNLLIDKEVADEIYNGLFVTYPGLTQWQQRVIEFAEKHGYVENVYGHRRHLTNELFSEEKGLAKRQHRQAINYLIQGCAADILKIVLTEINLRKVRKVYNIKGLKPVYDEISTMVPLSQAADYVAEMRSIMAITPPGYPLTLDTDVSVGLRWGDVEEVSELSQQGIEEVIAKQRAANAHI